MLEWAHLLLPAFLWTFQGYIKENPKSTTAVEEWNVCIVVKTRLASVSERVQHTPANAEVKDRGQQFDICLCLFSSSDVITMWWMSFVLPAPAPECFFLFPWKSQMNSRFNWCNSYEKWMMWHSNHSCSSRESCL